MIRPLSPELLDKLRAWLGEEGRAFFTEVKQKHGTLNACWWEGEGYIAKGPKLVARKGLPHPVHLREGMQVRNHLRGLPETADWTGEHDFDDNWIPAVEKALGLESP